VEVRFGTGVQVDDGIGLSVGGGEMKRVGVGVGLLVDDGIKRVGVVVKKAWSGVGKR